MTPASNQLFHAHVPRYTSYPTAPHFKETPSQSEYARQLEQIPEASALSLYFHIPFCEQLCWYCGCNTKITRRYNPIANYLLQLKKEIETVASHVKAKKVSAIHFGGGSPSILNPSDFEHLMMVINHHFDIAPDADISIELDPRNTSEAKVASYANMGVNRASLGVQDFSRTVQRAINRLQPFHMVYRSVSWLRAYGITDINLDLLYGLPHQTVENTRINAEYAATLGASRISLFGYAHVPWFKKHMRLIAANSLPTANERIRQFNCASDYLESKGYCAIGLDHFARPDDKLYQALKEKKLHRNFQGYTTDTSQTLLGFGPSAISQLPEYYAQNTPHTRDYNKRIESGQFAVIKAKSLTPEDCIRRDIIEQLMCYFTVNLNEIATKHNVSLAMFERDIKSLNSLIGQRLVSFDNNIIRLETKEKQLIRPLAACFDTYFNIQPSMHAQVA